MERVINSLRIISVFFCGTQKVTSAPDLVARQNEQEVDMWTKAFIGEKKNRNFFCRGK